MKRRRRRRRGERNRNRMARKEGVSVQNTTDRQVKRQSDTDRQTHKDRQLTDI